MIRMPQIIIDCYLIRELSPKSRYIVINYETLPYLHRLQFMIAHRFCQPIEPARIILKTGQKIIKTTADLIRATRDSVTFFVCRAG